MILNRRGKDWYTVAIASTPALSGWEASFDEGTTWVASTSVGAGLFRWMVAGPDAADKNNAAVLSRDVTPLLRAPDGQATPVRRGPRIQLES